MVEEGMVEERGFEKPMGQWHRRVVNGGELFLRTQTVFVMMF